MTSARHNPEQDAPQIDRAGTRHGSRAGPRGFALVITLGMLVLVTIAAMAFFVRTTNNRAVEASRSNKVLVDQIARSARVYVQGTLTREIAETASASNTVDGTTIYQHADAATVVPQRPLPASLTDTADFANLVRRSVNETVNGIGESNASSHSSAQASRNGRRITPARWNAPFLLGGKGLTDDDQVPNWIYLNRNGSVSGTPTTNAIGRFAYNLYNIGGLLDANVAGHDPALDAEAVDTLKGSAAGADLQGLPGVQSVQSVNDFIAWRNPGGGNYVGMVQDYARSGFLRPPSGVQVFHTRQDLIRLASQGSIGLTTEALPYLSTFTRAADGPTFTPDPDRPKVLAGLPTSGKDDQFNPSLIDARVTRSFTRPDGTTAQPGEPLLKTKFPLSRLALANGGNDNDLEQYLGLTRNADGSFRYRDGANEILRLEQVAAEGREPDFFELLQACIAVGSLGKAAGQNDITRVESDENTYYQIIQLGANLIDQSDSDSFPTRINFNGVEFSGIEDLPYITRIWEKYYRSKKTPDETGFWFQPEVWNPHRPTANTGGPTSFRFVADGEAYFEIYYQGGESRSSDPKVFGLNDSGVEFSARDDFRNKPQLLRPDVGASAEEPDYLQDPPVSFVGLHMGSVKDAEGNDDRANGGKWFPQPVLNFYLQYWSGDNWITYDRFEDFVRGGYNGHADDSPGVDVKPATIFFPKADLRSQRFGTWQSVQSISTSGWTLRHDLEQPNTRTGWKMSLPFGKQLSPANNNYLSDYPGWPMSTDGRGYFLGGLEQNMGNEFTTYADPDGLIRAADARYSSGSYGHMLETENGPGGPMSRPVVLNRPFRSVAEMGHTFRDLPYKSFDFFTADSGDAALLDAFCVEESDNDLAQSAAKVDLNTLQKPVLAALLAGAIKDPTDPATALTADESGKLADRILSLREQEPFANVSELATRLGGALKKEDFSIEPADAAIKFRRESVVRALSSSTQARTWNLLADIVSQAGRFPPGGGTEAGDFLVEAEERSWFTLAIDRPTATVLQTQTEAVLE